MTNSQIHWSLSVEKAVETFAAALGKAPGTALVLGSGLSGVADRLIAGAEKRRLPYGSVPGIPSPKVSGHSGELILSKEADLIIACGRSHLYENLSVEDTVLMVRALVCWGVKVLILTNASGSLRVEYKPGSIVIVEDHINLTARNPLVGPHLEGWGERFPDMSCVYETRLRKTARRAARRLGFKVRSGTYIQVTGPSYETPAEVSAYARLGADIVGMSTAVEAIAAKQLGAVIAAFSVVTNYAGGRGGKLSHEEVIQQSKDAEEKLAALIGETLRLYRQSG